MNILLASSSPAARDRLFGDISVTPFYGKNFFYKNIEAEICKILEIF